MKFPDSNFKFQPEGKPAGFPPRSALRAFTIIEMMVTVLLLGFIVLGLTATFVQTQRAFRAGTAQTDVLESGRAVADLLSRELEQTTPSHIVLVTNFFTRYEADSFNTLPATGQPRTNVLSCVFLLTENNRQWTGIGYVVAVPATNGNMPVINTAKVGTLYRWQYPYSGAGTNYPADLSTIFQTNALAAINFGYISTNLERVCDGIIDLRVLAYSTNGNLLLPTNTLPRNTLTTNVPTAPRINYPNDFPFAFMTNGLGISEYTCTNNAVPAYLDLEFGILESAAWDKYKSILNAAAQAQYLTQQAAHMHIFRRRIAVHAVDPEAYQ